MKQKSPVFDTKTDTQISMFFLKTVSGRFKGKKSNKFSIPITFSDQFGKEKLKLAKVKQI